MNSKYPASKKKKITVKVPSGPDAMFTPYDPPPVNEDLTARDRIQADHLLHPGPFDRHRIDRYLHEATTLLSVNGEGARHWWQVGETLRCLTTYIETPDEDLSLHQMAVIGKARSLIADLNLAGDTVSEQYAFMLRHAMKTRNDTTGSRL